MAKVPAKETKWNKETNKWETRDILVENNLDSEYLEDEICEFIEEELKELGLDDSELNKKRNFNSLLRYFCKQQHGKSRITMSNLPSTVKEKLNVFISKNDDGSIRGKLFYYGDFKIENVVKVYALYKNGNIACEHYYQNKKHHGLGKGYYMIGQLAKPWDCYIWFIL